MLHPTCRALAIGSVSSMNIACSSVHLHWPPPPVTYSMPVAAQGKHRVASRFGVWPGSQRLHAESPVSDRFGLTKPGLQVQARPVPSGCWFVGQSRQVKAAVSNHLSAEQRTSFESIDWPLPTPSKVAVKQSTSKSALADLERPKFRPDNPEELPANCDFIDDL